MNKLTQNILASVAKIKIKEILRSDKIKPVWAYVWVTRRCNFNCSYCYVRDNNAPEMTFEEMKLVIDKLKKMGCRMVAFMGGEPTLRKDLLDIIKYIRQKKMLSYLPTNGSLLTPQYIEELVQAGLNFVNLAVDDPAELAGQKSWKKETIDNLLKNRNKLKLIINTAVTRKNISRIPQLLELCREKDILMAIRIISKPNLAEEMKYVAERPDENLFFDKNNKNDLEQVNNLARFLIEKKRRGYPLGAPEEYFHLMKDFVNKKCSWPCYAGKFTLEINNDGKLLICSAFLKPMDIKFLDLDEKDFSLIQKEREKSLKICNKICLSPAQFDTSYYLRNPREFFTKKIC
ncbi:radical SAM protein [Patescibacteria group bacterium]|nr:radical SAM protein [Patescibacteria group bacterium]